MESIVRAASALTRSASALLRSKEEEKTLSAQTKSDQPEWKSMCEEAADMAAQGEKESALVLYQMALAMRPESLEIKAAIRALQRGGEVPKESLTHGMNKLELFTAMKTRAAKKAEKLRQRLEEEKQLGIVSKEGRVLLRQAAAQAKFMSRIRPAHDQPRADSRTDDWTQETPDFLLQSTQQLERVNTGSSPHNLYALAELKRIQNDLDEARYDKARYRCQMVLERTLEAAVDDDFPETDKQNVLANLWSLQGNACLEMGLLEEALNAHLKDLNIGKDFGLLDAKSRALTNVARVHARAGRYWDAIDNYSDKLVFCVSPAERAWIYHEMGRCYFQLGDGDNARRLAEKSHVNAQETDDSLAQFRAAYLLGQCNEQLASYEDALTEYERALDLAMIVNIEDDDDDMSENVARLEEAVQRVNRLLAENIAAERERQRTVASAKVTMEDEEGRSCSVGEINDDKSSTAIGDLYYLTLLYMLASMPEY